jgi:hypothetical protein
MNRREIIKKVMPHTFIMPLSVIKKFVRRIERKGDYQMSIQHVAQRITERQIPSSPDELQAIAEKYAQDTAVVLGKRVSDEGVRFGYVLIILIVRSRKPVTVMTRRQSQNFDKRNFNVEKIVYL